MKPHEENWEVSGPISSILRTVEPNGERKVLTLDEDYPRARLAAQAPAMARALVQALKDNENYIGLDFNSIEQVLRAAGVIP